MSALGPARDCPPRFGTPRSPERKTHGGRVALVAEALGTPLMPWQRLVADVLGEVDPATGFLVYREATITVPRQQGKTSLVLPRLVYRCLGAFGPRQRVLYTAQTRKDAVKKWRDEHVDIIARSVFGPEGDLFKLTTNNGSEQIKWFNGSTHGPEAATENAGHGMTLDEGVIDEAFSREDARSEQAMTPAMQTRNNAQLVILSSAGTLKSHYLRGKVDGGRSRVLAGQRSGVAYFEWSADDDTDPDDREARYSYMPALGRTVSMQVVDAARESMRANPGEYERAFMNQWPGAKATIQAIPADSWEQCAEPEAQFRGPVVWAIDTSPDLRWSSIASAGYAVDGGELVEVIAYQEGPNSWIVDRLVELADRHGNRVVALDGNGPAAALAPDLERAGFTVAKLTGPQLSQACVGLYNAAVSVDELGRSNRLLHRDQTELNLALAGADKMKTGDTWRWVRSSTADISPLYAATIARWALTTIGEKWHNVLDSIA